MPYIILPAPHVRAATHTRDSDGAFVRVSPVPAGNTVLGDTSRVVASLDGYTEIPKPAPAPAPVPAEVGSGQIRAALLRMGVATTAAGLETTIESAIVAAVTDPLQREEALALWRNGSTVKRAHPFIALVKVVLNKDNAWIDDLFRLAATL